MSLAVVIDLTFILGGGGGLPHTLIHQLLSRKLLFFSPSVKFLWFVLTTKFS